MTTSRSFRPILTVGMDISISGEGQRYAAYGVVSADYSNLQLFYGDWNAFLERHQLDYLRMSEAMAFRGQFQSRHAEWGEDRNEKRNQLLVEAAQIIAHRLRAGGSSIDFAETSGAALPSEKVIRYKKATLFAMVLAKLLEEPESNPYDFAFMCDDEQDVAIQFYQYLNRFKQRHPEVAPRINALCFCEDSGIPVLQAADLVAYVLRQARTGQRSPLEAILFPDNPEVRTEVVLNWSRRPTPP
jgi:hypothetical protein